LLRKTPDAENRSQAASPVSATFAPIENIHASSSASPISRPVATTPKPTPPATDLFTDTPATSMEQMEQ
jgi:hypothetical protein